MESINYDILKNNCPKAWEDFLKFYSEEFSSNPSIKGIEFINFPFELQLGIYLKYFNSNGVELDVCNTEYSHLPEVISDAFQTHEKVISHYS